jgi:ligand-binding sensor domain-containing protein
MKILVSVFFIIILSFSLESSESEWIVYNNNNSNIESDIILNINKNQNSIWFSNNSFDIFEFSNGLFIKHEIENNDQSIYQIYFDDVNTLWIGTGNGLFKYMESSWYHYNYDNSEIQSPKIYSICQNNENKIFLGTNGLEIITFDFIKWSIIKADLELAESICAIAIDKKNVLWIGTFDNDQGGSLGLIGSYNDQKWTYYVPLHGYPEIPTSEVSSIKIDTNNIKWITKVGGGVIRYNDTNFINLRTYNSGLPNDEVYDIAIDENDVKWLATGGGLAKFDGENWTVWDTSNSDLPNDRINCIVIDKYGNKWMGTDGGGVAVFREGGVVGIEEPIIKNEFSFSFSPNPTTETTNITFELDSDSHVSISVSDILGNEVEELLKNEYYSSGKHSVQFNTGNLSAGIYFCTMKAGSRIETKKIVVLD